MKQIKLNRPIYPDLTEDNLRVLKNIEKRNGIKILFLMEEGIEISYPDEYKVRHFPGDISLVDNMGGVLFTLEEFFTSLEISMYGQSTPILSIKIYDDNTNMLIERLNDIKIKKDENNEF